jgi:hypothetical protein
MSGRIPGANPKLSSNAWQPGLVAFFLVCTRRASQRPLAQTRPSPQRRKALTSRGARPGTLLARTRYSSAPSGAWGHDRNACRRTRARANCSRHLQRPHCALRSSIFRLPIRSTQQETRLQSAPLLTPRAGLSALGRPSSGLCSEAKRGRGRPPTRGRRLAWRRRSGGSSPGRRYTRAARRAARRARRCEPTLTLPPSSPADHEVAAGGRRRGRSVSRPDALLTE